MRIRVCFVLFSHQFFFFFFFHHTEWHAGSWFPNQGENLFPLFPLEWKHSVPTTGPQGKSLTWQILVTLPWCHSWSHQVLVWDLALIPGLGRSPGGGHGHPLQYSWLQNPHGQRNLAGYSPRGHKEWDMTEQLSFQQTVLEEVSGRYTEIFTF